MSARAVLPLAADIRACDRPATTADAATIARALMAQTTCGTCDSTDFELVTLHPADATANILVALCENWGTDRHRLVVADLARAVTGLRTEVDVLRRAIGIGWTRRRLAG